MADKIAKGRGRNGNSEKTRCKRGHPFDEENTRVTNAGRDCRRCDRNRQQRKRDARTLAGWK